ncbi:DNA polymerase beta superfamily protein [Halospeciosus flavus]|uniref:DNA polymerase beta superfamily protein n=1 Tax=Halospeciosus flavus TaxID=3032283 RepID=A0ABD5Z2E0_9EURY|nr:nucleotidyltransferase domain-containing protein [Halospeciosus flavus]
MSAVDPDPPEAVERALARVEDEYDVRVLVAHGVGSRAWNLAGPDSDYDVGVVFAQRPVEYVQLGTYVESVHDEFAGVDVKAWNAKRFAELLVDSNPAALEFLCSPLVYRRHIDVSGLAEHVRERFVPIDLYHHYRSLATRQHEKYVRTGRDPTVSRNLHVVRAALYARSVRETHDFPTLDFPDFLDEVETGEITVDDRVFTAARELVARKRAGEGDAAVGDPFGDLVASLPEHVDPEQHNVRGVERDRVNAFLARALDAEVETDRAQTS